MNITGTRPEMTSVIAWIDPLYGTCISLTPVIVLNNSVVRWFVLPVPAEA